MTVYAAFSLSGGTLPGESVIQVAEVESRSIDKLHIPAKAFQFYFFDAPDTTEARRDPLGHETNLSPTYIVASEIWSQRQLQDHFARDPALQEKAANDKRIGKLTAGEIFRAVWKAKAESAPFHAVARTGEILPVRGDTIVLDAAKRVLRPQKARAFTLPRPSRNFRL
jgi:hypothetical protein